MFAKDTSSVWGELHCEVETYSSQTAGAEGTLVYVAPLPRLISSTAPVEEVVGERALRRRSTDAAVEADVDFEVDREAGFWVVGSAYRQDWLLREQWPHTGLISLHLRWRLRQVMHPVRVRRPRPRGFLSLARAGAFTAFPGLRVATLVMVAGAGEKR